MPDFISIPSGDFLTELRLERRNKWVAFGLILYDGVHECIYSADDIEYEDQFLVFHLDGRRMSVKRTDFDLMRRIVALASRSNGDPSQTLNPPTT